MINTIYTVCFLVSLIQLILLVGLYSKRISVYYILTFVSVLITNFGYMQLVNAESLQTALFANQVSYLGSCFTPILFLLCQADLCKVKLSRMVQILLWSMSIVIFALVSSIGVLDVYYKSVELVIVDGTTNLVKEYGPLHNLYPVYILITFAVGVSCVVKAITSKKDVPYTTSVLLLITMFVAITGYFCKGVMHFVYEVNPITYNITLFIVLILIRRISLLNVANMTANSLVENDLYGFVVFDKKGKLLGSDAAAKKWFPELNDTEIGKEIHFNNEKVDGLLKATIDDNVTNNVENDYVDAGKYTLEIKISPIKRDFVRNVYCIYLRDDTVQQKLNKVYKEYNTNLEREVKNKTEKIRNIQDDIIISMASIVENRDNNTGGHIARTSDIVKIFVKHLKHKSIIKGFTDELAEDIVKAAPLHDFGKIAIPDEILNKPERFTADEYEKMKMHSSKGAVIVARILQNSNDEEFRKVAINVAHYHHEKWDGNGYPEKLSGNDIPFEARVMALADVFDALVSKRVYKESMSYDEAFRIIEESCGTHFDPVLCMAFLECKEELIELYDSYED